MPHIQVTIAGRSYRMACGDGEEQHLEGLAAALDAKVAEMRAAFGEIGDMRLHVMAALTIADELGEAKRRVATLEGDIAAHASGASASEAAERQLADRLVGAAERVEELARSLAPHAPS